MHGPGLEIVEAGGQQQCQAALEYVDARIGIRQRCHHVAQLLALGRRQTAQRWKQLLNRRQAQLGRERIGECLHAEHAGRECRAVRPVEDSPLRGEHFGDLLRSTTTTSARAWSGGLDEIAQALRNRDTGTLGVAHVFTGDGAGERGDALRGRRRECCVRQSG